MKKLIVPIFAIATIFTSCTKDENPTTKTDIKTTSVKTAFNDSKNLTGKMVTKVLGGQDVVATLENINFEFASNVYSYQTAQFFPTTSVNSFTIPDVALGMNTLTVTANTKINGYDGMQKNKFFNTAITAQDINSIQDFKDSVLGLTDKPYLKYKTVQQENINLGGNSINVALQPITGRISTGFRLSNNDIDNGVTYTVLAENNTLAPVTFGEKSANNFAFFDSANPTAIDGNFITYTINLYQNGILMKNYIVTENFVNGSAVNTVYFIDKNAIYKDTATVTLSINDLVDNDSDKPLD